MALTSNVLRDKLREFCDADYSAFGGFPTTKDAARKAWAEAFDLYISTIEAPPLTALTLKLVNVKGTFESTLKLVPIGVAASAAADFADAWKAAIDDIGKMPAPVADASGTTWSFDGWVDTSGPRGTLASTLTTLFEAPSTNTVDRLGEIADAFHAATKSLVANATSVTAGGSSGPPTMNVG